MMVYFLPPVLFAVLGSVLRGVAKHTRVTVLRTKIRRNYLTFPLGTQLFFEQGRYSLLLNPRIRLTRRISAEFVHQQSKLL
jgi:hypothetical protein